MATVPARKTVLEQVIKGNLLADLPQAVKNEDRDCIKPGD